MKKNGFTLIELLVTMGIIAVLTGMAVFNFNQARMRARDVQRKSDLSQLQKAMELYKNDNGRYPEQAGFQTTLTSASYTKVTFNDPKGPGWYTYLYMPDGSQKTYILKACLENRTDSTKYSPTENCGTADAGVVYQVTNP